jgi:hypothetical protein
MSKDKDCLSEDTMKDFLIELKNNEAFNFGYRIKDSSIQWDEIQITNKSIE